MEANNFLCFPSAILAVARNADIWAILAQLWTFSTRQALHRELLVSLDIFFSLSNSRRTGIGTRKWGVQRGASSLLAQAEGLLPRQRSYQEAIPAFREALKWK